MVAKTKLVTAEELLDMPDDGFIDEVSCGRWRNSSEHSEIVIFSKQPGQGLRGCRFPAGMNPDTVRAPTSPGMEAVGIPVRLLARPARPGH